jgi:hypothetical protein
MSSRAKRHFPSLVEMNLSKTSVMGMIKTSIYMGMTKTSS